MKKIIEQIILQKYFLTDKLVGLGKYKLTHRITLDISSMGADNSRYEVISIHRNKILLVGVDNDNYGMDLEYPISQLTIDQLIEISEQVIKEIEAEDELIPITFATIKAKCGWSDFCNVTGANHYAINEGANYNDRTIFDVQISHAKKLNLI